MKTHYIYKITNKINGKVYIGKTLNTKRRWAQHRNGKGSKLVKAAMEKHGIESFSFDVLFEVSEQQVDQSEKLMISFYDSMVPNGYNLTAGGDGGEFSEEVVKKLSEMNRGERNPMYGKTKLDNSVEINIVNLYATGKYSSRQLAKLFGVNSKSTICNIIKRKSHLAMAS